MKGTLARFWHRENQIKDSDDDRDDNEEEGQRCPVIIQQVHIVAARRSHKNEAAQEHKHTDAH